MGEQGGAKEQGEHRVVHTEGAPELMHQTEEPGGVEEQGGVGVGVDVVVVG